MVKPFGPIRLWLCGCCILAALTPFSGAAKARTDAVLYSFQNNGADGYAPQAYLINVRGVLYSTTTYGGTGDCDGDKGCGTVFSFDLKTGAESSLYSFQNNGTDGNYPYSGLINVHGMLYGTTFYGGVHDEGVAFSINPTTGAESVLHSFDNNTGDGFSPYAGLIELHGVLYGTTVNGGLYTAGAIYSIDLSTGAESVLFSFGEDDGANGSSPYGQLINVNGVLYGTTDGGGELQSGTVFSFDPSSSREKILYSFCAQKSCTDGAAPFAGLIYANGMLYGTTQYRGFTGSSLGCGTVFSINPGTGAETVLYKFQCGGADAVNPIAGLAYSQGALYGTTPMGGAFGNGAIYSVNATTGTETVLHSFQYNGVDGFYPYGSLLSLHNKLYGNTAGGGTQNAGTIFKIKP